MAIKLFFYVPPMAFFLIITIQIIAYIFLFLGGNSLQKARENFYYSYLFKIVSVIGLIAIFVRVIISIVYFTDDILYVIYYFSITLIFIAIEIVLFGLVFIWIGYKNLNYFGKDIIISGVFYVAFISCNMIIFLVYALIVKSFALIEFYIIRALLSFLSLLSCVYFLFFAFKIDEKNLKISTVVFLIMSINSILAAFVAIYYFIAYNA